MKQESVFLGTGAAEMYPNPFCGCEVCERARRNRETRLRAAFLLDETMMIDFGPDVCAASQHYGVPLYDVEHVLVTHTHEDHFNEATFSVLTMTDMKKKPMNFYLSSAGLRWVERVIEQEKGISGTFGQMLSSLMSQGKIAFHALEPYQTYEIGGKRITPLKTNHGGFGEGETAQNYLIEWERGCWLYAADTGLYGESNLEFLREWAKNRGALDAIIVEGTYGSYPISRNSGHMNGDMLVKQMEDLRGIAALDMHTRVFITHINQVQHYSHAEYQNFLHLHSGANITVAYDGMRI